MQAKETAKARLSYQKRGEGKGQSHFVPRHAGHNPFHVSFCCQNVRFGLKKAIKKAKAERINKLNIQINSYKRSHNKWFVFFPVVTDLI